MCEIFFLYGRNGNINSDSLEKLLKTALQAAEKNSDGFGIFNEKKQVFKTAKKLKNGHIPNLVHEYADSKFVVVHLRLATNGSVCKANAHPFRHENDILVHNGVVRNTGNWGQDKTDSYEMMRDIIDTREHGDTVSAIEETMEDISGRTSVFMHDKNHDLYYWRETSTFTMAHNPVTNEYVGATDGDKLNDVWDDQIGHVGYFDNLSKKDPEEGKILKITDEDIEIVGSFSTGYGTTAGRYSTGSNTHPRRASSRSSGKSNKSSQTTSDKEDEDVKAACVLKEDEIEDDPELPETPSSEQIRDQMQEDEFDEEQYQREKVGFTEDEWEDYMKKQARKHESEGGSFPDMYGLENDLDVPRDAVPESVAEEVYEEAPEEQVRFDEQEYWEQKEQEFYQNQQERLDNAMEEFDEEDNESHPLQAEEENYVTVGDTVEQEIEEPTSGLQKLFEGSFEEGKTE